MTTPLLDPADTNMEWQKIRDRRQQIQEKTQQQDTIVPDAASLNYDTYYNRLNTIRNDSANQTAGAIAVDRAQKQRQQALDAQNFAAAQAAARQQADNGMNAWASGAGGMAGGAVNYDGSDAAIAQLMRNAGFPESAIGVGLGIVQAESSGRANATHPNTSGRYAGTIDQGLWQINTMHQGNPWYPADPFDPQQSTNAAFALWKAAGGQWTDWVTYNQGLALAHAVPPPISAASISPYAASTSRGLQNVQVSQALNYSGVPTSTARATALSISQQVLNIPYVWGGNSLQSGVDCSGLVQQVYGQLGIQMPRTAAQQATTGVRVGSYDQLQPGDLVAFSWAGGYLGPGKVSHIAIYLGGGKIIEAAGGSHGDIRSLGNSAQDRGAIYIHTRFPGE